MAEIVTVCTNVEVFFHDNVDLFQDWLQYEEITDTEETGEWLYMYYQHMPAFARPVML